MFYNTFISIAILIIFMGVGYFSGFIKFITDEVNEGLNKIILNITLPCMIIASFKQEYNTPGVYENMLILFILYIIFKAIWFIISLILYKKNKDHNVSTNRFSILFPNCGYMGIPVSQAVFGNQVLIYTAIYIMFFNIFTYSLGIGIYRGSGKINVKENVRIMLNPVIFSVFIGLGIFVLKITLPQILLNPITSLGNMTTPLSFIVIGYSLTKSSLKEVIKGKAQYIICALKLIVIPITALLIFRPFLGNNLILNDFVIIEAMPVAAVAIVFANNFKKQESEYASKVTFLTTILTIVTVPLIAFIISIWR
ncbi:MAG: AEC family transporter [Oscillospiraceae bacterium]|nr:AEC family transporter [Oscillospiraceae bacterium]